MKLTLNRAELLRALGRIRPIVENASLSIDVGSVRFTAKPTRLEIAASDGATSLILGCAAVVDAPGRSLLDLDRLVRILQSLPVDLVEISSDDGEGARIQSGNLVARLPPTDAIPWIRDDAARPGLAIPSKALLTALGRTSPCMPNVRLRFAPSAMFVETRAEHDRLELRLVATDGHRLATAEIVVGDATIPPGWPVAPAIPCDAARMLMCLLPEEGDVILGLDSGRGFVRCEAWILSFRLSVDRMPAWRHFLDLPAHGATTLDRHELVEALRRLVHLGGDRLTFITLHRAGDELTLVAPGGDISARDSVHVAEAAPGGLSFRLDPGYVLEMLEGLTGDSVTLSRAQFTDPARGVHGLCRVTAEGDPGYFGCVMPMADDAAKVSDVGA